MVLAAILTGIDKSRWNNNTWSFIPDNEAVAK